MRKLILEVQLSLDGFAADSDGATDWAVWNWTTPWTWDKPLQKLHEKLINSADTALHGRPMITGEYLGHWREVASRKGPQQQFASKLLRLNNYAFSRCRKTSRADSAEIITSNYVTAIKKLKGGKGKNIIAFGGVSFVASLIKSELVDEFYLIINPCILGKGKSIYKAVTRDQRLKLKNATAYRCGVAVLHYAKVGSSAP